MKKSGFAKGVFWTLSIGIVFVIIMAAVGVVAYNGYTNASLEASYSRGDKETKIKIEKKDKLSSEIASVDKKQVKFNEDLLKDKTKLNFKESGPFYGIKENGRMIRGILKGFQNKGFKTDFYGLFTKNQMYWKGYSEIKYDDGRVLYQYNEYKLDENGKVIVDKDGIYQLVDSYLISEEDFAKVRKYISYDISIPFDLYDFDTAKTKTAENNIDLNKTSNFPEYSLNEIFKIAKETSRWAKGWDGKGVTALDEELSHQFHSITKDYREVCRRADCGIKIDAWTFLKIKMVSEIAYKYYSNNTKLFWKKTIAYRKDIVEEYLKKKIEFQKYLEANDDCIGKLKGSDWERYINYCIDHPYNKIKKDSNKIKLKDMLPMPKAWAQNSTGTYYWTFSSDVPSVQRIARKKCNIIAKSKGELDECEIFSVNGVINQITKKEPTITVQTDKDIKYNTDEKYYALIIGNNNYEYLEKLDAAENDAEVIADVLNNKYGFEVDLLLNADYDTTVNSLFKITNKLKKNDNLLIYYAGHGELDKAENRGYWLPVDASFELRSKWISNQRIVDRIKATKAKHVLLIADSCFSGTLMRSSLTPESNEVLDEKNIERLKSKKTRLVITSGGNEPVVDSDGGEHSLFALKLIDTLKKNNTVINSQMLFENIRRYVISNADQTPERALVHKTGHDGGDFLFFPKE
jgi:hypothetical protein